jgi:hypothetical protein
MELITHKFRKCFRYFLPPVTMQGFPLGAIVARPGSTIHYFVRWRFLQGRRLCCVEICINVWPTVWVPLSANWPQDLVAEHINLQHSEELKYWNCESLSVSP